MGLAGERLEREQTAFTRFAARAWAVGAFFAEGIPFPAGLAFALPTAERCAAVLADEGEAPFGHRNRVGLVVPMLTRL